MKRLKDEIPEERLDSGRILCPLLPGGYPLYVVDRNFNYIAASEVVASLGGKSTPCVVVCVFDAEEPEAGPGINLGFSADEARQFACEIITAANNFERFGTTGLWEISDEHTEAPLF